MNPPNPHLTDVPTEPIATYDDALRFLNGLDVSAMKLGLDRVRTVLQTLDNPQDALPMVHIAGTNGKGSVTAMLGAILKQAGYQVGSFTSPHLVHVRERIALNGNPILPDDFQYEVQTLKAHLEALQWPRDNWPTYFEFLNIVAYQYFKRKQVDITLFETGLGGRLDSTNVVKHPNLTVITTIGWDHMQHLGGTLAAIASEKAGILKAGSPLVLGDALPEEASTVILERAEQLDVPVFKANANPLLVTNQSKLETGLHIRNIDNEHTYQLSLLGPYQAKNLAVVLACVQQLRQQGFQIDETAVQEGLKYTHWPVRFQYIQNQHLLLDGSHNNDGFDALRESLSLYCKGERIIWLISLRNNRSPERLLLLLQALGQPVAVIVTQAQPNHLYYPPERLASLVRQTLAEPCPVVSVDTPAEALQHLQQIQRETPGQKPLGLVTGSLYTAGDILHRL